MSTVELLAIGLSLVGIAVSVVVAWAVFRMQHLSDLRGIRAAVDSVLSSQERSEGSLSETQTLVGQLVERTATIEERLETSEMFKDVIEFDRIKGAVERIADQIENELQSKLTETTRVTLKLSSEIRASFDSASLRTEEALQRQYERILQRLDLPEGETRSLSAELSQTFNFAIQGLATSQEDQVASIVADGLRDMVAGIEDAVVDLRDEVVDLRGGIEDLGIALPGPDKEDAPAGELA